MTSELRWLIDGCFLKLSFCSFGILLDLSKILSSVSDSRLISSPFSMKRFCSVCLWINKINLFVCQISLFYRSLFAISGVGSSIIFGFGPTRGYGSLFGGSLVAGLLLRYTGWSWLRLGLIALVGRIAATVLLWCVQALALSGFLWLWSRLGGLASILTMLLLYIVIWMLLLGRISREFCWTVYQGFLVNCRLDFGYLMINLKEYGDTRDIVNDGVVLSPFSGSSSDYCISGLLGAVLQIVGPDYLGDLLIREELPNTVTSYYDELVFGLEFEAHDFGVTTDADRMGDVVAERATHGKTGCILVLEPNALRSQILAHTSLDGVDSATDRENSLFLDRHARFVVLAQRCDLDATLCTIVWVKYSSGISGICRVYGVSIEKYCHACWTTKRN